MKRDWLWDRKITLRQAKYILSNPSNEKFIHLVALLLSRKNDPKEVFSQYLNPREFCRHWPRIKKTMRKNQWNNPRIDFWQAIYQKLLEKYHWKGISLIKKVEKKPLDEVCKIIGENIKKLRKQKNLNQVQLAKRLNVSQQLISRIEQGRENLSIISLKNIVNALDRKVEIKFVPATNLYHHLQKEK